MTYQNIITTLAVDMITHSDLTNKDKHIADIHILISDMNSFELKELAIKMVLDYSTNKTWDIVFAQ
jgi:hypothetical protein